MLRSGASAQIGRVGIDGDGGRCRRRRPDRLQQLRQIEYPDDVAGQIAPPVGIVVRDVPFTYTGTLTSTPWVPPFGS